MISQSSFAKLRDANPHLRHGRSQLAEKVAQQAQKRTTPILIGGMSGMGKTSFIDLWLSKSVEVRRIPLVRIYVSHSLTWADVESSIKIAGERNPPQLVENSPGIVAVEWSEHLDNDQLQTIVKECMRRAWTSIYIVHARNLFLSPIWPEDFCGRCDPLAITLERYKGNNGQLPYLYILPPMLRQEAPDFFKKWFSPTGHSYFGIDLGNARAGLPGGRTPAQIEARGAMLLDLLQNENILDQVMHLTGGIGVLILHFLNQLWDGKTTITDHRIENASFDVFNLGSPTSNIITAWLSIGLPGIFNIIRNGQWLTDEKPLPEHEYQSLKGQERLAIDDAFKVGFLEIRKGGLVIRPKLVQDYLTYYHFA